MGRVIYIWRIASDCPDELVVKYDNMVDSSFFRKAVRLPYSQNLSFSHLGLKRDFNGEEYIPNTASLPLVSLYSASAIMKLSGVQVQYIPARVVCSDGVLECMLLNPLHVVSAVDWSLTEAVFIPGTKQVLKFKSLQIITEKMEGSSMSRLDEYRPFVLVSDKVKQVFLNSSLCQFELPVNIRP